jgi:hypothetical protein
MQLELHDNMLASAASYGHSDGASEDAGTRAVYGQHAEAMARLHPLGPRTMYSTHAPGELCVLSAALEDIFETLRTDEPQMLPGSHGPNYLVVALGDRSPWEDLSLPWLTTSLCVSAARKSQHETADRYTCPVPCVDLALAGGQCGDVVSRARALYDVFGSSCHVDPMLFLEGAHKSPVLPRIGLRSHRHKNSIEQDRILGQMLVLDNLCCLRACLDPETTRLFVLPEVRGA